MSEIVTWSLVKTILRPENATATQMEEARRACQWLNDNLETLKKVCEEEERDVLQQINAYFLEHHEAPTFTLLERALEVNRRGGRGIFLDEFHIADAGGELEPQTPEDLPAMLTLRAAAWRNASLAKSFKNAMGIALIGADQPVKGGEKIRIQGADDAIRYILGRIDRDVIRQGGKPTRCSSAPGDTAFSSMWDAAMAEDDRDKIATGLTTIDTKIPLRKGQLVGLLGHAGQGKSTLARTIVYNAAAAGASVLVMPLELEAEEEVAALAVIHACRRFPTEASRLGVTKAVQYQRRLSHEARQWLSGVVKGDFQATFDGQDGRGCIQIARPAAMTLDAVLAQVDQEHRRHPLDVVLIDYPRCLRLPGKAPRQESEDMVSQLKDLAAHFDAGRRLLVLVPIQSNRAGYEAAKKNGGAWEMSAVLDDSSYERYADLILGVYRDDDLDYEGKVRLSTPKVRNGAPVPPWILNADRAGRYFTEGVPLSPLDDAELARALELI